MDKGYQPSDMDMVINKLEEFIDVLGIRNMPTSLIKLMRDELKKHESEISSDILKLKDYINKKRLTREARIFYS